jgi:MFS family permease
MTAPAHPRRTAAIAFILVTALLDVMSMGIVIPVLPQLIETLSGSSTSAGLWNGLFVALWAAMQFLCSPVIGSLSDRFGRRPVILISVAGLALDYVLMALAPNLWWLALGRILAGITSSSFTSTFAYMADITAPEDRARGYGLIGAAFDDDAVWCGVIADGVHVLPSVLRLTLKAKSPERVMLVTDAMPGVGNEGAPFHLDGHEIFVRDGICTDAAGTLAGSGLDMAGAVRNIVAMTGIAVPVAARMAAATPAAFLGLGGDYGSLEPGYRADFALLDSALRPTQTWIGGRRFA